MFYDPCFLKIGGVPSWPSQTLTLRHDLCLKCSFTTCYSFSGSTSLAIKATNGVVLATEKKMSTPLMDSSSVQKISALDDHIGMVYAGMGPDARVLVNSGRKQCQSYRQTYKEPIPVGQLVRHIASVMQEFTQSGGVRPFGISLLVAGQDATGPHLYQVLLIIRYCPLSPRLLGGRGGG